MPDLILFDGEGEPRPFWEATLLATLDEPTDENARGLAFAYRVHAAYGTENMPPELLDKLLAVGLPKARDAVRLAERRWQIAADHLIVTAGLAKLAPRHASVGKARRMLGAASKGKRDSAGRPLDDGDWTLKNAWRSHRSVAPLGAAVLRFARAGLDTVPILWLAAAAEHYHCFGERHRPPIGPTGASQGKKPLLDPATTWRIALPPGVTVPKLPPQFDQAAGPKLQDTLARTPVLTS